MTISSMTGFARSDGELDGISWHWELKSVNGKGLDVRCRVPPGHEALEQAVRSAAGIHIRRGNLQVNLQVSKDGVIISDRCEDEPSCDQVGNEFSVPVDGFSEFALVVVGQAPFRRADSNVDGIVDILDAIFTLTVLFLGDGEFLCRDAADSSDDAIVEIGDAILTLSKLFLGGPEIPAPGLDSCGADPTPAMSSTTWPMTPWPCSTRWGSNPPMSWVSRWAA